MNIHVRLTFTEGPLGTAPNDEDIYKNFVGSKAPDAATLDDEVAALGADAVAEKGMTVFPRGDNGEPIFWAYQVKGFFKDACSMLSRVGGKDESGKKRKVNESSKLTAFKKVIDGLIFVAPNKIPLDMKGGELSICERPLRAQTMQGERVALASSETAPAGSQITFDVICLSAEHAAVVREWLNYGVLRGLGQWRNSGRGKFTWEELDDAGNVIGGNASLSEGEQLALVC